MDADRFDILTRSLTTIGSRRTLTTALVGGLAVLGLAGPDDAAAAKSGKCKRKPGECETCKKGKCERKNGKKRCRAGKIKAKAFGTPCSVGSCQNGICVAAAGCPSGTTLCSGACVDINTDPRNCGTCGTRCQVNATCTAGTCTCVNGVCSLDPVGNCCPAGSGKICSCSPPGGALVTDVTSPTCEFVGDCPAGTTACVGDAGNCDACCPTGSTCDTSTGTCLQ